MKSKNFLSVAIAGSGVFITVGNPVVRSFLTFFISFQMRFVRNRLRDFFPPRFSVRALGYMELPVRKLLLEWVLLVEISRMRIEEKRSL